MSTFGVHVRLHDHDRVVVPEVVGAGVRDLGAVKVPATYDVIWHCVGGPVSVLIDGFQVTPLDECDDGQATFTRSRPPGRDLVSIKVSTDSRSVWALAIVAARQ
ncbi:MAG TPA: hypothetical protein VFQ85_14110 [Mycobacteriales bacterium]|nr:hypothetical protein [Mycobacteriales bacterium]